VKYYKGLGTSTSAEAKEYFGNLSKHVIQFNHAFTTEAVNKDIELAFDKKLADARKEWLTTYDERICVDHSKHSLTYSDFIHKELIHFSVADNRRSIPALVDGLKPGQRKILFALFKRLGSGSTKLPADLKVAQLSGYVAEHSAYHHGEMSLCQTIIGMAQDFCGANNVNTLMPVGQFGTRGQGGKDFASARYIFTNLNQQTRMLFPEQDGPIHEYMTDEGMNIEPAYYVPVIPLVLANGAEGIGTGWSSFIPQFSPLDIVQNIRKKLQG